MDRRQANDGHWYTYGEFCDHYGHAGRRQWDTAKKKATPEHIDVKPLDEEAPRNRDRNEDGSQCLSSTAIKEFCEKFCEKVC